MYGRAKDYRDLKREMDELSEEERELEEMVHTLGSVTRPLLLIAHSRMTSSVYEGSRLSSREDAAGGEARGELSPRCFLCWVNCSGGKADEATPEDDEEDSAISSGPPSVMEGEEEVVEEEEVDLDANMEDLDESDEELEEELDMDMDVPEDIDATHSF